MPNITIYVDRDLAEAIRAYDVQISPTCQRALRRAVRVKERAAEGDRNAQHVLDYNQPGGRAS